MSQPQSYPSGFNPTRAGALYPYGGSNLWPPVFEACSEAGLFLFVVTVAVASGDATIELKATLNGIQLKSAGKVSVGAARGQTVRVQFGPIELAGPGDPSLELAAAPIVSGCSVVGSVENIQLGWR